MICPAITKGSKQHYFRVSYKYITSKETPILAPIDSEEYFLRTKLEMITYAIDVIMLFGIPIQ